MGIYLRLYTELFIHDNLTEFLFYFPKIEAMGRVLCYNHNIVALGEIILVQSKPFPDEPLDLIPFYCIPYLLARGYPQSVNAQPVLPKN